MKIVALEEMKARCERKGSEVVVDISMIDREPELPEHLRRLVPGRS